MSNFYQNYPRENEQFVESPIIPNQGTLESFILFALLVKEEVSTEDIAKITGVKNPSKIAKALQRLHLSRWQIYESHTDFDHRNPLNDFSIFRLNKKNFNQRFAELLNNFKYEMSKVVTL